MNEERVETISLHDVEVQAAIGIEHAKATRAFDLARARLVAATYAREAFVRELTDRYGLAEQDEILPNGLIVRAASPDLAFVDAAEE